MIKTLARPLLSLLLALPLSALADAWRTDAIVFLNNPGPDSESGQAPAHPDDPLAVSLDDTAGLAAAGITLLADKDSLLNAEWANLRASRNHKALLRLSWLQNNPPARGGPALRVFLPGGDGGSGLGGWLRLTQGRYLHVSADLEYQPPVTALAGSGAVEAYRLRDSRKLAPGSLQYLDSSRVGVLVKVSRVDTTGTASPTP